MKGVLFSLLAGIFVSIQGVINTRASHKIGLWETTALVHAVGLVFALIITVIIGNGNVKRISEVNPLYLFGGAFGVIIVFSVMKGISLLGATLATSITLIAQLIMATIIDCLGLFGTKPIPFDYTKPLGVVVMIIGIIIFKIKG